MKDAGSRAKSKRDEVDWDAIKARFLPMDTLPNDLIASRTEGERALAAFNRALEQSKTGNSDVAMIVLGKLTSRWPTFLAASTLYGVLWQRRGAMRKQSNVLSKCCCRPPIQKMPERLNIVAWPCAKSAFAKKRETDRAKLRSKN